MDNNPQIILKDRYLVVPRTLILVFQDDNILLQKGAPTKKIWAGYYNGLGGHIERGEDALSAARRELKEEAGLECLDLHLCGTVMIDVEEHNGITLFVMTGNQIRGIINESDEGSLHWVNVNDLDTLKVVEDIPEIVARILTNKQAIFHAHYGYDENGKRITTMG
ncbi:NUDIX domain-containing protein [bacterium]|nr:NUDIX domain-containing protein [bacterium]